MDSPLVFFQRLEFFMSETKQSVLGALFSVLIAYFIPIFHFREVIHFDWDYFNSLSLVVRSSLIQYRSLPIHDPWACGGLDIWANPQSRIFTPFFLFDLLLYPRWANLISLIIYGFFGFIGMRLVLRHLQVSQVGAMVGAFIFINSSWFGLHFTEGHIPYGSFQILPLVLFCYLRLTERKFQFLLFSLFVLFLLDGSFYCFIFSIYLFFTCLLFNIGQVRAFLKSLLQLKNLAYVSILSLTSAFLSAPKIIPVLAVYSQRKAIFEESVLTGILWRVFFDPFQNNRDLVLGTDWRFHEVGCYLGVIATLLVLAGLFDKKFFKSNRNWWGVVLLFLWIGAGWVLRMNPWALMQKIPFFNQTHVQSRFFIIMFLGFVILLMRSLDRFMSRRVYFWIIAICLLVEFGVVRNYPFYDAYKDADLQDRTVDFIKSTNIESTKRNERKPDLYYNFNHASSRCYEPARPPEMTLPDNDDRYRGEAYLESGSGEAKLLSYVPGRIEVSYSAQQQDVLKINTHALAGWNLVQGQGRVISSEDRLLTVSVLPSSTNLILEYRPWYVKPVLMSFVVGLSLWVLMIVRIKKGSKNEF